MLAEVQNWIDQYWIESKFHGSKYDSSYSRLIYQSFEPLKIFGRRATIQRVSQYKLRDICVNKKVLEVGSAFGAFIPLLCRKTNHYTAIEPSIPSYNFSKKLINYTSCGNVELINRSFETCAFANATFDVIISQSIHACVDGSPYGSVDTYFDQCFRILSEYGILAVEFHSEHYESTVGGIGQTMEVLNKFFDLIWTTTFISGFAIDEGRVFSLYKKKGSPLAGFSHNNEKREIY